MTTPPHHNPVSPRPFALTLTLALLLGCNPTRTLKDADTLDGAVCPFNIYWPPQDPENEPPDSAKPLLRGNLTLDVTEAADGAAELRLTVTVTRPSEEEDREFWNSRLAYADIDWMDQVRVWDADDKWLWPNLPFLLRLPGEERVERYGGTDPVKRVDNDFAAVLIRTYDAAGEVESAETKATPLVSAEWHAEGKEKTGLETIVHVAKSDPFVLHLGGKDRPKSGRVKVWLIYADFLGTFPPRTWPKEYEWAGGILAYFEIDWEISPEGGCRGIVRNKRPEESTGFKWDEWVAKKAVIRLSDEVERGRPNDNRKTCIQR